MKIKKSSLEVLFSLTKATDGVLSLSESRARDTFIKPLLEQTQTYMKDREEIYKNLCIKSEDGTPDLLNGNKYQFKAEDADQINTEIQTLNDEEVEITAPEKLKEILEKSEYKPKIGEAEIIDEIIKSL